MNIAEIATSRRTAKAFDPDRKLPPEIVEQIETLLRFSPSSVNSQPWHYVIASSDEGKARVAKATVGGYAFNEPKVRNASHVVVFCTRANIDEQHLETLLAQEAGDGRFASDEARAAQQRGRSYFVGMHRFEKRDAQHWMEKQTYLALGTALTSVLRQSLASPCRFWPPLAGTHWCSPSAYHLWLHLLNDVLRDGGLGSAVPQGSAAFWIYWLLFILARGSTNCFVMLSGYYLSERKGPVHVGRLFHIGAQVWFYSMLTFCVAVKAGAVPLSAISLLRALLPLTSNGYWFASAYFLMYLSVPVLNAVVQSLDRRQYKTLLLVALLLQSVWGTLFYWATDATFVNNGYSFIWFYILYFMAAYFRKYRVTVPSGLCLLAYLAASAAGLFNRMLALRVENALHLNGFVNTVNGYQALDTVIASAALFLLFQNLYH